MLFVNLLATVGLALSMSVEVAALPRGRRSAAHNKFVLVRSPQAAAGYSPEDTVMTTVADVTALSNSTSVNSTVPAVPILEEGLPTLGLNETASVVNGTGANTVPPALNETDPVVSDLISSLAASTTAYATFSYSAYVPTATMDPPAVSASPSSDPVWEQPADPVDQALQAAQSYAMQQAIGSHMPTVIVELVMVPTQEADGTWDYVVHIGNDGTATAVPTFSAGTTLPTGSASQVIDSPVPAYTTQASPYIHTPMQPVSVATQASPYIHTPVQPGPVAQESSGSDDSGAAQWSEAGSEATDVAANPTPWASVSPTPTSYYIGQGYVSAISSDGRGAATFAYSMTIPSAIPTQAEPAAWTSGKGQQHAYPWMTASENPLASPVVTAEPSAWTSGKGQQHAYPWMTASEDHAASPMTTSAWISGHGQQHAYPWTTQVADPSPTDAMTGASSATTHANGVIVATLVPVPSITGGSSSVAEQTIESPWLIPATQPSSLSPSSIETAGTPQSTSAAVQTDSVTVPAAPSPNSTSSGETQPLPEQSSSSDPVSYPESATVSTWSTSVEAAQATSVYTESSQDASNMTVTGAEVPAPSSTSSGIMLIPILPTTEASTIAAPTGSETYVSDESAYHPEATATQSETLASAITSAASSASDLPVVSSGMSSSPSANASSTGFMAIQSPMPTGSDSASPTESVSSMVSSVASPVIASATENLTASTTEPTSAVSSIETQIPASSSASVLPFTTNSTSAMTSVATQASAAMESQSIEASATGVNTTVVAETLVSSPTPTDVEAVATLTPIGSGSASSTTSQTEQSMETNVATESDAAVTSTVDDGSGIATETFTAWTTLDVTATSTAEVANETGSSAASTTATPTRSASDMSLPASSLIQSNTDTIATSTMPTSAAASTTETQISSSQTESSSSVSDSSATSAWESTAVPTTMSSTMTEAMPSSTVSAVAAAFPTSDADIPFCEDDGEGEWEEVWVDEEDIQPGWEVLE